jgi:hypothetical protein
LVVLLTLMTFLSDEPDFQTRTGLAVVVEAVSTPYSTTAIPISLCPEDKLTPATAYVLLALTQQTVL